jgi:adenylylsulfate kinase
MSENVVWQKALIGKTDRQKRNGHKSFVIWLTGLSAAGKSTIANALEKELADLGVKTYLLDGDNIRHGLSRDLGFTDKDRRENIRRIGEVSKLFVDAGVVVLTAFISPFRADRDLARELVEKSEFIEVYVKCPLDVCEKRDPKGLYAKARSGKVTKLTGIDSPYEEPLKAEIVLETDRTSSTECVNQILKDLRARKLIHTK